MFDLGFAKDLRFYLGEFSAIKKITMLFSATLSFRVNELAYEHMNNPHTVRIKPDQRIAEKLNRNFIALLRRKRLSC